MFNKLYARDNDRVFTPVYVPNETYSFILNGDPITDPDFSNFVFRLVNPAGVIVASSVGTLSKVEAAGSYGMGVVMPYWIYSIFTFPIVNPGQYYFVIYDPVYDVEKLRSGAILCEPSEFESTTYIAFRHSVNRSGYPYEQLAAADVDFYNMFRLQLTQTALNFESDKKQYRNATDQKFRNERSYLDYGYKLQFIGIDEPMMKGLAELAESDTILFDYEQITPKTQLTEEPIANSVFSEASFEVYINQVPFESDSLYVFGTRIFYTGTPVYNPLLTIDQNDPI